MDLKPRHLNHKYLKGHFSISSFRSYVFYRKPSSTFDLIGLRTSNFVNSFSDLFTLPPLDFLLADVVRCSWRLGGADLTNSFH